MLSEHCCPLFLLSSIPVAGAEWCHIRGAPSVSRWRSKRDGSIGCTRGELRQAECRTKCYQLSLPYADGIRHGWASLSASKRRTRDYTFHLCEYLWLCVCVCAGLHMCSHSWGERGLLVTDFSSWTSHHFSILRCLFSALNILAIKAEQTHWT